MDLVVVPVVLVVIVLLSALIGWVAWFLRGGPDDYHARHRAGDE